MSVIYIPDNTWTDLAQEPISQKFMKEYLDLLQTNLQKVKVKGDSYSTSHYACDQIHEIQLGGPLRCYRKSVRNVIMTHLLPEILLRKKFTED